MHKCPMASREDKLQHRAEESRRSASSATSIRLQGFRVVQPRIHPKVRWQTWRYSCPKRAQSRGVM